MYRLSRIYRYVLWWRNDACMYDSHRTNRFVSQEHIGIVFFSEISLIEFYWWNFCFYMRWNDFLRCYSNNIDSIYIFYIRKKKYYIAIIRCNTTFFFKYILIKMLTILKNVFSSNWHHKITQPNFPSIWYIYRGTLNIYFSWF